MKNINLILIGTLICMTQGFGQDSKIYRFGIQFFPVGLATESYGAGAEFIMNQNHGLVLGGSISPGNEYEDYHMNAQYRKYKISGTDASFWGIFVNYTDIKKDEIEWEEKGKKEKFKLSSRSLAIGPFWGKRWIWKSGFSLQYNIGYGLNITTFDWKDKEPEKKNLIEGITKFVNGFQASFSIGYYF